MTTTRAGFVALIGRPNAGKSTLMNRLLGSKLAITSPKPQTTRDRIAGVHTSEHTQMVLVDTPGIHKAWTALNKTMVDASTQALADVDVVCWLEDLTLVAQRLKKGQPVLDGAATAIAQMLADSGTPVIFVANKIDLVPPTTALPAIAAVTEAVPVVAAVPVSAQTGEGLDRLMRELEDALPESPFLYPAEHWTDVSERFLASEIVREQLYHLTEQEIPYATAVEITAFDESEREAKGLVRIHATILVERPQQKGIVIGKGGQMIKRIGVQARKELQALLDCKVHLELFVKVEKDWTKTDRGLRRAGYTDGRTTS